MRIALACLALAATLSAQQGRVAGPVSGWVFDPAGRVLRPVRGVPGAALFGDPVPLGIALSAAFVSPNADSAIALSADGAPHFFRIADGQFAERALPETQAAPESVVYSPSGTAAALIAGGQAWILQGLPDSPALAGKIDLGSVAARVSRVPALRRTTMAISDDGSYLLVTSAGSAVLLSISGERRDLAAAGRAFAAAFAPRTHMAALAGSRGLMLFADLAGSDAGTLLTDGAGAQGAAATIAFSADGSRIIVAGAAAREIAFLDRSGNRTAVPCDCSPTVLARMGGVFRLNDPGNGPMWLLDAAAAEPRTVFVPAISAN